MNLPCKPFVAIAAGAALGITALTGAACAQPINEETVRKVFAEAIRQPVLMLVMGEETPLPLRPARHSHP